ncbi:hypothetical protein D9M68_972610 [compost metagenome]
MEQGQVTDVEHQAQDVSSWVVRTNVFWQTGIALSRSDGRCALGFLARGDLWSRGCSCQIFVGGWR